MSLKKLAPLPPKSNKHLPPPPPKPKKKHPKPPVPKPIPGGDDN
ncbi:MULTISPECIES: hypothetical protein [Streptomyces]|uniref:Uncharacterized protein n=1 Tax=Streptomyces gilvifuscus TaxID=1550617 RepID=A0ABT5G506_9ACTN|nr:hypothetical protein [Streptomyces gilvifuscus]MDC2959761.1 hypothetical protein [Streptomyces gilvifuscus]